MLLTDDELNGFAERKKERKRGKYIVGIFALKNTLPSPNVYEVLTIAIFWHSPFLPPILFLDCIYMFHRTRASNSHTHGLKVAPSFFHLFISIISFTYALRWLSASLVVFGENSFKTSACTDKVHVLKATIFDFFRLFRFYTLARSHRNAMHT